MKTLLLIIFAIMLVGFAGISYSYAAYAEQKTNNAIQTEIKIPFGETVYLDGLKITFYDIEDSRCPSDVTCIWEGKVSAMIRVGNDTLDIGGPQPIGFVQNSFPPYSIMIKDIQPYPVSTKKPDYVAILQITKPDESADEQICGEGFVLTNGKCMPEDAFHINGSLSTGQKLQTGSSLGNDSAPFGWLALVVSAFIVAAYAIMKIKTRKKILD